MLEKKSDSAPRQHNF